MYTVVFNAKIKWVVDNQRDNSIENNTITCTRRKIQAQMK